MHFVQLVPNHNAGSLMWFKTCQLETKTKVRKKIPKKKQSKRQKTPLHHHYIKFQFHQSNGTYQAATTACTLAGHLVKDVLVQIWPDTKRQ